jgi:hypothetical protein
MRWLPGLIFCALPIKQVTSSKACCSASFSKQTLKSKRDFRALPDA